MRSLSRAALLLALVVSTISQVNAKERVLYFEKVIPGEKRTVILRIEGNQVYGYETWQPTESHGSSGTLDGVLDGDLVKAKYDYVIEGSEQSEERVFKFEGDDLLIGQGELVDPNGDGQLVLKNASKVEFTTRLTPVTVTEAAVGSAERKAIMDAMRAPVSKQIGQPVEFTGTPRVADGWASFSGGVATKDGKAPKNEEAAFALELDFFALLKKTGGSWKVMSSGFAGDIGAVEEAKESFPEAPWVLFH